MGNGSYRTIKGGFLAAAALFSVNALAGETEQDLGIALDAGSDWQMDYADNSCKLARKFGTDGNDVFLVIESSVPGDIVNVTVFGPCVAPPANGKAKFTAFPNGETREAIAGSARTPDGKTAMVLYRVPLTTDGQPRNGRGQASNLEFAATVELLSIGDLQFRTGPLDKPLRALQSCIDDLLATRGLSPAERANFAVPKGDPSTWLTPADLPLAIVRPGRAVSVLFRMNVDTTGKPIDFVVIKGSDSQILDREVRKIMMRRARFYPILDAEAKPATGVWVSRVRFSFF